MIYNTAEILREIDERAEWIEYKGLSKKNRETSFEDFRQLNREKVQLEKDCAAAVARCLAKRRINA